MITLRCESCGSIELVEDGGYYRCPFCGAKYKREAADAVAPKVDQGENVKRLLERADMYWSAGLRDRASRIYEQILEIDASNEIARKRI